MSIMSRIAEYKKKFREKQQNKTVVMTAILQEQVKEELKTKKINMAYERERKKFEAAKKYNQKINPNLLQKLGKNLKEFKESKEKRGLSSPVFGFGPDKKIQTKKNL